MKIKWLIILFAIFLGIIITNLFVAQQNNNTALLVEESPKNAQSTDYSQPLPSSITTIPTSLPLPKSRITVIKDSLRESEDRVPPVQPEKNIETAAIILSNKYSPSNTATQEDNTQAGITKIGKHPTPKEANEMNSAGIVMY